MNLPQPRGKLLISVEDNMARREKGWDQGLVILSLCILVMFVIVGAAFVTELNAGKPADNIRCLSSGIQQLVWKNDTAAVFRAQDGGERFVTIRTADLEVGATYEVVVHKVSYPRGVVFTYTLQKRN